MSGDAPAAHTFRTTLHPRGPAAAVILSDEQVAAIGGGARTPPVKVTVGGHTFDGRIARMRGESMIGFNRAVREACDVQAGDEIEVTVVLDTQPREVEVPPELAAALEGDREAADRFAALSFTHRKEFARWVAEAKRAETRERRVAQALEMIREGRTR